jgi:hypothetical protein
MPAAEHVHVEMVDGLAAVGAGVDDDAVAFGKALVAGYCSGRSKQVAEKSGVIFAGVSERCDVLARDHEKVGGRLRVDVRERDTLVVLEQELGRDGSFNDLAE